MLVRRGFRSRRTRSQRAVTSVRRAKRSYDARLSRGKPGTTGTTIALCMIVRDEAAVIERCLASVRPHIDAWVICDTGSVDDTPDRVRSALAGIPRRLHHRPLIDFG